MRRTILLLAVWLLPLCQTGEACGRRRMARGCHCRPVAYYQPTSYPRPMYSFPSTSYPRPVSYSQPTTYPRPTSYSQPTPIPQPTSDPRPTSYTQAASIPRPASILQPASIPQPSPEPRLIPSAVQPTYRYDPGNEGGTPYYYTYDSDGKLIVRQWMDWLFRGGKEVGAPRPPLPVIGWFQ